jgi:uncharacterized protein (TIGR02145 family)
MRNKQLNIIFLAFGLGFLISCSEYVPDELFIVNNCDCIDEENHTYGSVIDIDQNTYNTVIIGNQEWMAENLKTTRYNDGTIILKGSDSQVWGSDKVGAYCWYNNDEGKYKAQYGALYNWYAVETDKLCPTGWHVPSKDEWTELRDFISSKEDTIFYTDVANALTTPRCWYEGLAILNCGTDDYGFSALGAGERARRYAVNGFVRMGHRATWWTGLECDGETYLAWYWFMYPMSTGESFEPMDIGRSIRCVKD